VKDYVSVTYDENKRPRTDYPYKLAEYLCTRFSIEQNSKFLDIGCGRGEFMEAFKKMGMNVFGVDKCEYASKKLDEYEVKNCDLENERIDYESNSFDVVFSKSVIEHFHNPENFIKECYRILKPGGRLIILTPDWISQMRIFYDDYTHRTPFTADSLKDFFEIHNFLKINTELFYQLPIIWKVPIVKMFSWVVQLIIPAKFALKSPVKFLRWSKELMILGTGLKKTEDENNE